MKHLIETLSDHVHQACSEDDCPRPVLARGWCRLHYLRWWRTGATETPLVSLSLSERLWASVDKSGNCWIRAGGSGQQGYTRLNRGTGSQRRVLAHVLAWEEAAGESVPDTFNVLHTCDTRPCVRNDDPGIYMIRGIARPRYGHLWLGTNVDNVADKVEKGRQGRGDTSRKARATPEDVRTMRRLFDANDRSHGALIRQCRELAAQFGISPITVRHIVTGRRWQWVS